MRFSAIHSARPALCSVVRIAFISSLLCASAACKSDPPTTKTGSSASTDTATDATPSSAVAPASTPSAGAAASTSSPALSAAQTPEMARLYQRLEDARALQQQMQNVIASIAKHQQEAQALQQKLTKLQQKLSPEEIAAVMQQAKDMQTQATDQHTEYQQILASAKMIDQKRKELAQEEKIEPTDPKEIQALKQQLQEQQAAIKQLSSATAMAFRSLALFDQLTYALPLLEKKAAEK